MFTIESVQWNTVKLFWERHKNYDMTLPIISLSMDKVYIDTDSILKYEKEKTFGFYHDGVLRGVGQIQEKIEGYPKVACIANMAVDSQYRTNGIGKKIMEVMQLYIQYNQFDMSLLYSSYYATQFHFYNQFGYLPYGNAMIKFFRNLTISSNEIDKKIESIGRF